MSIKRPAPTLSLLVASLLALPGPTAGLATPPASEPSSEPAPSPTVPALGQLPLTEQMAPTSRLVVTYEHPSSEARLRAGPHLDAVRSAGNPGARFVRLTGSGAAIFDLGRKVHGRGAEILERVRKAPGVTSVTFDQWMTTPATIPDDPRASSQWNLLGPAHSSAFGMDVLPAWDVADGSGVVVAVVDSGIMTSHPDLAGQSLRGYDMIDRDDDATDTGACSGSHGTLVSGPIAAAAGNGQGIFGAAPGARIQPVRVSACGGGWSSDGADGIRWAAGGTVSGVPANPTPAAIINASFGVPGAPTCLPEFASAISDARGRGALVVVAAGNDDVEASWMSPGNCDGVLNVGSVDRDGRRSSFSNHGAALDISAPGQAIWTTARPDGYAQASGTSLSAPHVAAAAALVKSAFTTFTHDDLGLVLIDSALTPAADAAETGCASRGCGAGIVNAGRAFARLAPSSPPISGLVFVSQPFPLPGQSFSIRARGVDGIGVAAGQARIGDGPWQALAAEDGTYGGSTEWMVATLTAPAVEGAHAVCVRADDGANGPGAEACVDILVDAAPPTATAPVLSSSLAAAGEAVTFTSSLSDANGIAGAEYRIDSGPWIPMRPGDGAWGGSTEPTRSTMNERVAHLAVGAVPCVVMESRTVRCWGHNLYGLVGDGSFTSRSVPVELDLAGVRQVSAGGGHACAVLEDRTVRCWGSNSYGQVGEGGRRYQGEPVAVSGLTEVVQVAAGPLHTCALRLDTTVWCWGPALGLGDGTEPPAVRATPGPVAGLSGVVGLNAGGSNFGSTCALLAEGTVRCWGDNAYGSLGDGSTTHRWTPVSVSGLGDVNLLSGMLPCATLTDGRVMCWGANLYDTLGQGTTDPQLVPVPLTVAPDIQRVASGQAHKCVTIPDRTVRCWGRNLDGQLGDGTQADSSQPRTAIGLSDVVDIRAGWDTTCALRGDGSVWCWGWNEHGQLGDGSTALRLTPVRAAGLGALAEGTHSICVRATDAARRTSSGSACASLTISDGTAPSATITRPGRIIGAASTWAVRFDEPVSGLTAADLSLGGAAGSGCTIAGVTGAGATYDVSVGCSSSGEMTLTLGAETVVDAAGHVGPASPVAATATVDRNPPIASPPRDFLAIDGQIRSGGVPIDLRWSGSDDGAGVRAYDVRTRSGAGDWVRIASGLRSTSLRVRVEPGMTHRFAVRAVDRVGNVGPWTEGQGLRLHARQELDARLDYTGSWRTLVRDGYWEGRARSTQLGDSRVTMTFTGRRLALVASRTPGSGWVAIRIDGKLIAEVGLHATARLDRRLVWTKTWSIAKERTVSVTLLDSRMDIDAFVTTR